MPGPVVARGAVHERQPRPLAHANVGARDVGSSTPRARREATTGACSVYSAARRGSSRIPGGPSDRGVRSPLDRMATRLERVRVPTRPRRRALRGMRTNFPDTANANYARLELQANGPGLRGDGAGSVRLRRYVVSGPPGTDQWCPAGCRRPGGAREVRPGPDEVGAVLVSTCTSNRQSPSIACWGVR